MVENPEIQKFRNPNTSVFREITDENMISAIDHKKYFYGILRHIPLILACTLFTSALFAYISYKLLHTYTANAVLIFQDSEKNNRQCKQGF